MRAARLPGLLFRITTPAGGGFAPRVTGPAGQVRLGLRPTGDGGPDTVTIVLNQDVRWDIRLPAGAGELHLDLSRARVARLALGGAGLVDLRLPRPAGTVPVTLTDGAGTVDIAVPRAVLVWLRAGAGSITTPSGSPGATDRYVIDARTVAGALRIR